MLLLAEGNFMPGNGLIIYLFLTPLSARSNNFVGTNFARIFRRARTSQTITVRVTVWCLNFHRAVV